MGNREFLVHLRTEGGGGDVSALIAEAIASISPPVRA
jgi:hypothetical protein